MEEDDWVRDSCRADDDAGAVFLHCAMVWLWDVARAVSVVFIGEPLERTFLAKASRCDGLGLMMGC